MFDTPITQGFFQKPRTREECIAFSEQLEQAANKLNSACLEMSVAGWGEQMGFTAYQQAAENLRLLEEKYNPFYVPLPPRITKPSDAK